jgi:hypothetical protein
MSEETKGKGLNHSHLESYFFLICLFICASYTSDKGLLTRIHGELEKLNSPKINEPIKKWATELNRTVSKQT